MIQFHETVMGNRFFSKHMPELIKVLGRIACALEESNLYARAEPPEIDKPLSGQVRCQQKRRSDAEGRDEGAEPDPM